MGDRSPNLRFVIDYQSGLTGHVTMIARSPAGHYVRVARICEIFTRGGKSGCQLKAMAIRLKRVSAPLVVLAIVACGGGSADRRFARDTQPGQSLVGTWDAKLSLSQPYQLELNEPVARRICGTIGFVENRSARSASVLTDNPRHLGVYDLNLSLLGLDWLGDQSFPAAVATWAEPYASAARTVRDSVRIVLNPRGQEQIILRGRYDLAGISGAWTAQSSRGTASGSFWLTPHVSARVQSRSCA